MDDIYQNGKYLRQHSDWHLEDSPWKAKHIFRLLKKHHLSCNRVAEIGCGAGGILAALSTMLNTEAQFYGYDIAQQAIALAQQIQRPNISFFAKDLLADKSYENFDILLLIDVIEHIQDPLTFLEKCRGMATHKIFHIPLDISAMSVLRNSFIEGRHHHGHLHYYTFESATAMLADTNYKIIDFVYTDVGTYYYRKYPTFRNLVRNIPRWALAGSNPAMAARVFGGYSVLVLAE